MAGALAGAGARAVVGAVAEEAGVGWQQRLLPLQLLAPLAGPAAATVATDVAGMKGDVDEGRVGWWWWWVKAAVGGGGAVVGGDGLGGAGKGGVGGRCLKQPGQGAGEGGEGWCCWW